MIDQITNHLDQVVYVQNIIGGIVVVGLLGIATFMIGYMIQERAS